eukprot:TRINITY_DN15392_c0_g1_i1.p1 TRINITY_DN15392_c0_g1~~TRINITY_DN15392_c0_g1_i1.p1  ORF type:complete len:192 (-),score=55.44 TRINITY_DN15392_c0_g1_i1:173-748(-)
MAGHQKGKLLIFAGLATALFRLISVGFVAPSSQGTRRATKIARPAEKYESGKVNLGIDLDNLHVEEPPPTPVLECDEGCMTALFDCLEEGCSVDALMKLDTKLAEDEERIAKSVKELKVLQKTSYTAENAGTLAWLSNFLNRSGSLRGQLRSLRGIKDSDFAKDMIKAMTVAFGGGRPNDYPRVGVSAYTA